MENLREILSSKAFRKQLFSSKFALEKENQRADAFGFLSKKPHPELLKETGGEIVRDFSETQIEMITPPFSSIDKAIAYLELESYIACSSLEEDEILWACSLPPILPHREEDIHVADVDESQKEYREYLVAKYGKRKQMMCGIHINFNLGDDFFEELHRLSNSSLEFVSFKNEIYLRIARNYLRYEWLTTYLFGATPKSFAGLFENEKGGVAPVRSLRNSPKGYRNAKEVKVSFSSIERHVKDIQHNIAKGLIREEREVYTPIRLKAGRKAFELQVKGIQYLEFRDIDINPFLPLGINRETLRFFHLYLLYLLVCDEEEGGDEVSWREKNDRVALEPPNSKTIYFEEGMSFFKGMLKFYQSLPLVDGDISLIRSFQQKLQQPEETLSAKMLIFERVDGEYLLRLSKEHKETFLKLGNLFEAHQFSHHHSLDGVIEKIQKSKKEGNEDN